MFVENSCTKKGEVNLKIWLNLLNWKFVLNISDYKIGIIDNYWFGGVIFTKVHNEYDYGVCLGVLVIIMTGGDVCLHET